MGRSTARRGLHRIAGDIPPVASAYATHLLGRSDHRMGGSPAALDLFGRSVDDNLLPLRVAW